MRVEGLGRLARDESKLSETVRQIAEEGGEERSYSADLADMEACDAVIARIEAAEEGRPGGWFVWNSGGFLAKSGTRRGIVLPDSGEPGLVDARVGARPLRAIEARQPVRREDDQRTAAGLDLGHGAYRSLPIPGVTRRVRHVCARHEFTPDDRPGRIQHFETLCGIE